MSSPLFPSNAVWISSPVCGGPFSSPPAPYLRRAFYVEGGVRSAWLTVTARGLFECELNGQVVGDDVLAPGWTDYTKRVPCHRYDVTQLVTTGENVIGAILGDGWYCGRLGWKHRQNYGDRPELLTVLEIETGAGATITIVTDGEWKATTGPIRESDILWGETYDARLELGAWSSPGYDESTWSAVRTNAVDSDVALEPRLGPPVRRSGELPGVRAPQKPGSPALRSIIDFGQNFSGRTRIECRAARGTEVRLRFAEILDAQGNLYTENLRSARATDYYICRGGETEAWEARFTFHGFRYLEILGLAEAELISVTGIVLHSAIQPIGTFRCSNELLNQLQHNIVWGQKSNFLEIPTDCPQRDERLGWTGDAQVFARTAAFNFDVREFFRKWMRDVRDAQAANGAVPPVAPDAKFLEQEEGGPAWSDATIICPWTMWLCYGDRSILEEHYDSMERYMGFVRDHRVADFIRSDRTVDTWGGFGDWLALDGSTNWEGLTPKDLIGTAYYALDATIMAETARLLNRPADEERYRKLRADVETAFQRRFITPDGLIVSGTQTARVLALHFGLVHGAARERIASDLVWDIERRDYHLATGFVGTPYILDALADNGHLDVAYKLLEQETFPSWLFPVKNGATTIWERWNGWTPEAGPADKNMNSYNHYAYGAVGAWMYKTLAGIDLDPANPGYAHIIFRPRPGGSITYAEAALETPHGRVAIKWEARNSELAVSVTVPDGTRATFDPPPGYGDSRKLEPGAHELVLRQS